MYTVAANQRPNTRMFDITVYSNGRPAESFTGREDDAFEAAYEYGCDTVLIDGKEISAYEDE